MDRSEPTLVPEWLKGTGGGSAGSHHNFSASHSDNSETQLSSRARPFQSQFPGATRGDYDSFYNLGSSDRPTQFSSRRSLSNNNGVSERVNLDKDHFSNTRAYASFRRSSSFRSDSVEREKAWVWDKQREGRDKARSFGSGGHDWNISREIPDSPRRWFSSGSDVRLEGELRCSRSIISNKKAEDEANKSGNELQSVAMAPPVREALVSNIQKADFERNFPSLGAEERQGIQSNLANVTLLNSSSIWQGQRAAGRSDSGRTSSPGLNISVGSAPGTALGGVPAIGADGWKSALADVPLPNGALQNGSSTVSDQQVPMNSIVSKSHGLVSASGLNMAETLVQNPARPHTPQLSVEVQRLEELALKQSRQLIPVTPSMPKTMGLCPSEKLKAKSSRTIDTNASTVKATQSIGLSHLINSPKLGQGVKLVVLKQGGEMGNSTAAKTDSSSPRKGGNTISSSLNTLAGGTSDLGGNMMGSRKQRLPADHRALSSVPTSSTWDGGLTMRHKEGSLVFEEKKSPSLAQKRSDFFNSLRKQSDSQASSGTQYESSSTRGYKADKGNEKMPPITENNVELKQNSSLENEFMKLNIGTSVIERTTDKVLGNLNSFISGQVETTIRDASENDTSMSTNRVSVKVGSEEEEAAFLRSLGWEENAGGEEALTDEEINAFYQEHMMVAVNAIRRGNHRLWNLNVEMHIGNNVESMSSGIGSSESA